MGQNSEKKAYKKEDSRAEVHELLDCVLVEGIRSRVRVFIVAMSACPRKAGRVRLEAGE